ncbi:hypothetical protein M501DRAFT_114602 [Patellaria atrata CBS 101060]|uniref:Uncharacterized protein n=1 Tax=Patellaria atrata CBS 101060 TaxID=1346257 RepID=A0A9P4SK03_9PEZI|nr:hypothetical protein M501DRAFT_114602 [Patellaria atrata CBS 101060]
MDIERNSDYERKVTFSTTVHFILPWFESVLFSTLAENLLGPARGIEASLGVDPGAASKPKRKKVESKSKKGKDLTTEATDDMMLDPSFVEGLPTGFAVTDVSITLRVAEKDTVIPTDSLASGLGRTRMQRAKEKAKKAPRHVIKIVKRLKELHAAKQRKKGKLHDLYPESNKRLKSKARNIFLNPL